MRRSTRMAAIKYGRVVLGFAIAPLSMGIVFAAFETASGGYLGWWYIRWSVALGYPVALVVGVPLYLFVLEPRRRRSLPVYAACGAGMGLAAYLLPLLMPVLLEGSTKGLLYALNNTGRLAMLAMMFGAISASVFWVIAIWRMPDEST